MEMGDRSRSALCGKGYREDRCPDTPRALTGHPALCPASSGMHNLSAMKRTMIGLGAFVLALSLSAPAFADHGPIGQDGHGSGTFGRATLTGFASLLAETYVPGSEPSGSKLGTAPINGI